MIAKVTARPHRLYYLIKIIAVSIPMLMLSLAGALDYYSQTLVNSFSSRAQNCIGGIRMVSDHEGWAGSCSDTYYGMLHYQRGQLTWVDNPDLATFSMNVQDGWGAQIDGSPFSFGRHLFHYMNGEWIDAHMDLGDNIVHPSKQVDRIETTGLGDGWGVGFDGSPSQDPARFLAHYDHGSWHMTLIPRLPLPLWIIIIRVGLALLLAGLVYFACWLMAQAIMDPQLSSGRWQIVMGCLCVLITGSLLIVTMTEPFIFPMFQPNLIMNIRAVIALIIIIAFVPLLGTVFARKSSSQISV